MRFAAPRLCWPVPPKAREAALPRSLPRRLVLASASPRRRELLRAAGLEVLVRPAHAPEQPRPGEAPESLALRLAREKAGAARSHLPPELAPLPLLAADTVVHMDSVPFPKPRDPGHAVELLTRLSGRWHRVTTGYCLRWGELQAARTVTTRVRFRRLSPAEIRAYVETGDPMDKAGAYGIQGPGGFLVDRVEGSYTNVVGLPLAEVLDALAALAAGTRPAGG